MPIEKQVCNSVQTTCGWLSLPRTPVASRAVRDEARIVTPSSSSVIPGARAGILDAMTTRTEYHIETAAEFLVRAHSYLADDDLLQASEKGWGAAAQAVKAVAEARGWNHNGHRQLHQTIRRLVEETGRSDMRDHFNAANTLHANFYDGFLEAEDISANLQRIERLVEQLRPLAT